MITMQEASLRRERKITIFRHFVEEKRQEPLPVPLFSISRTDSQRSAEMKNMRFECVNATVYTELNPLSAAVAD